MRAIIAERSRRFAEYGQAWPGGCAYWETAVGSEYLQSHPVLEVASILVMLAGAVLVLAAGRINFGSTRSYVVGSISFFVITRIVLLIVVVKLAGHATGPDSMRWTLYGQAVLEGRLPYVDFPNPYGPLLPYLLSAAFLFLGRAVAPVVVFVVFDALTFGALHLVTRDRLLNRKVATLYLVAPVSWLMVVRFGQDEAIGSFFVVVMLILVRKGRNILLPLAGALGVACTKVLFLLPVLPIISRSTRPARAVPILALALSACYLPFWVLGGDVFAWAPRVGQFGGPSIWQAATLRPDLNLMGVVASLTYWRVANTISIAAVIGLAVYFVARARRVGIVNGVLLLYSGLMLTTTEAWPHYALLVLPLLCLRVASSARQREVVFLAGYSFLMVFYFYIWVGLSAEVLSIRWLAAHATVVAAVLCHCYLLSTSLRASSSDDQLMGGCAAGLTKGPGLIATGCSPRL